MISTRGITKSKRIYHLIKSDRINALRKQYDAFLEEDKKRKERNEFILGRLDKMRYTTALVPVRHKPSAFEIRSAIIDRPGFQSELSSVRDFHPTITNQRQQMLPDIQVRNNEESYLFQEISKKYILIPKSRTMFMNSNIRNGTTDHNTERLQEMLLDQDTVPIKELRSTSDDNTDWKSKYEILNILKNEEKGKSTANDEPSYVNFKQSVRKDSILENNQDQSAINYDNYVNADVRVETPKKHINEFPEKDLPADILHYNIPQNSDYSLNTVPAVGDIVVNTDSSENNNIIAANVEQTNAIGDQLQNITLEYKESDEPNIDVPHEVSNYLETQPEPDVNLISMTADIYSNQSEENVNVQDEYPVEAVSSIHEENVSVAQHELADPEQVVYDNEPADSEQVVYDNAYEMNAMQASNYNSPSTLGVSDGILENERVAEVSNDQQFAPNIAVQMQKDVTDIPQEQTYLNSDYGTVEQTEPVIEQTENPQNISESIEDFEAEQKEMFYSEQTDKNYPNQHGDEEHPGDYPQDQFSQNQEYAYYENTGEPYPAASNDEEVTQQYDPSYDQQYTGLDQASEQYGEQYQQPEPFTDQVEPQYEDLQYQQQYESQQEIQETLDIEDGYTAQKSEESADIPPNEESIEVNKSDEKIKPAVTNN
ncbi:hypothetical protein PYW07_007894 [Mythimna separata]|uniref:Uncharacterized protein n=1 Tax=Mythimna separata TaxID=271217 RepID=A0AAD7YRS6_MYTSE|nr:hypothetical protein PYW07_007894 [Mythimna separata]